LRLTVELTASQKSRRKSKEDCRIAKEKILIFAKEKNTKKS